MSRAHRFLFPFYFIFSLLVLHGELKAQDLPPRYPMLELFTNTPCPICANQNPGLFSRLANYDGEYHLVSFYPGRPYASCIFYQANIPENTARWQFYTGEVFGTPTVAINGIDFKTSNGVTNTVLDDITGNTSWLKITVDETTGASRDVDITLQDHAGSSLVSGRLFAVIVEKEIQYNAPNGETLHHNVFRQFLTATDGDVVDLSSGTATATYTYDVDPSWVGDQVHVVAWLMDTVTKEIYNSGTRFDPDFISAVGDVPSDRMINIYPNPTTGQFIISLPGNQLASSVKVFNAAGALVFAKEYAAQSEINVDGSVWVEGSYVVRVQVGDREIIGRVSVVK